jgi:hypothetical protein
MSSANWLISSGDGSVMSLGPTQVVEEKLTGPSE